MASRRHLFLQSSGAISATRGIGPCRSIRQPRFYGSRACTGIPWRERPSNYSLDLAAGDLLGVIGPNGAGKTTLFNLLTGLVRPTGGHVFLNGDDITGLRPDKIARRGIARTFQKIRLFQSLTALQNISVAIQTQERTSFLSVLLSLPNFTAKERDLTQHSITLLERVGIADVAYATVNRLSYSQQRRLEIACALALAPQILLLDEPTAGMNPTETETLIQLILDLRRELGLTIVLIEHNMRVIMNTCQHIQALNYGEIIGEGTPDAIRHNPSVIEAYLGHSGAGAPIRPATIAA